MRARALASLLLATASRAGALGCSRPEHRGLAPLAFDIGFFDGSDTELLLRQGYRVVAVEANPLRVTAGRRRFERELASGQLRLIGGAIANSEEAEAEGRNKTFYINKHLQLDRMVRLYVILATQTTRKTRKRR